jgi:DNA-binding GntR family transcriptional regulator
VILVSGLPIAPVAVPARVVSAVPALVAGQRAPQRHSRATSRRYRQEGQSPGPVKTLLRDHDLEPGSKLSIDGLARELDVSQTPIREALARGESAGLVVRRPNAGYLVAPLLDPAALDDLYDVRLLLEPACAARAAQHATRTEMAAMRHTLDRMVPTEGDTYEAYRVFAEQDAAFHNAIAEASRSTLIADTLRRFRAHTHAYRLYFRHGIASYAVGSTGRSSPRSATRIPRRRRAPCAPTWRRRWPG